MEEAKIVDNSKKNLENSLGAQWICMGAGWSLFFGYEAMGWSKDPEHCWASDQSDFPVPGVNAGDA